ncbi:hypothetical protein CDIK_0239 [Cucumispora dikerogammari]|nr:hypothetical protein CDIK_0239 [Cucumispora dikerogammari]
MSIGTNITNNQFINQSNKKQNMFIITMGAIGLIITCVVILFIFYLLIAVFLFLFGHGEKNKDYRKARKLQKEIDNKQQTSEIREIVLTETSFPPKVVTVKVNKLSETRRQFE